MGARVHAFTVSLPRPPGSPRRMTSSTTSRACAPHAPMPLPRPRAFTSAANVLPDAQHDLPDPARISSFHQCHPCARRIRCLATSATHARRRLIQVHCQTGTGCNLRCGMTVRCGKPKPPSGRVELISTIGTPSTNSTATDSVIQTSFIGTMTRFSLASPHTPRSTFAVSGTNEGIRLAPNAIEFLNFA